ncbi:hypothetical protein BCR33DRAFT_654878 [Rhizoclosmatium globosum]|uniref:Velvet domain-containing protein n=1 Tax=Rhizoclosmatium globosum TaxID=329046 RepID=A0A1Y2D5J6_9FUNG|nr:hypothetical protein BCR33DRAFT_654878 [Rhizoclosmatium globosum]|eukprot:ORY53845.1 hypothetical protein BCR33DRAFT_654878 [Rhizoclosmatium globosum]
MPSVKSQIMMGQLISISRPLVDLEKKQGLFYVYPELAVRASGRFRLRFDLFDMSMPGSRPVASAVSDVFRVYNPKEFPGIPETTALSRCFAKQGAKIRQNKTRTKNAQTESSDDY